MKRPIVVANWKMQLGLKEEEALMDDILNRLEKIKKIAEKVDIIFCPPFFALESVLKKSLSTVCTLIYIRDKIILIITILYMLINCF